MKNAQPRAGLSRASASGLGTLFLVLGLALSLAAACGPTRKSAVSTEPVQTEEKVPEKEAAVKHSELDFFDAATFDRRLSEGLRESPLTMTVHFPAPVTVNKIPERMDKWFAMLEKHEGTVKLEEDPESKKEEAAQQRSLVGIVASLAVGAYNLLKEKHLYAPVKDYNATVYYMKGSGKVTRVVFSRK